MSNYYDESHKPRRVQVLVDGLPAPKDQIHVKKIKQNNIVNEVIPQKYWSIGKLAVMFNIAPSKIRFWCEEFNIVTSRDKTSKRQFSAKNVEQVKEIYDLIVTQGYTHRGAKMKLSKNPVVPPSPI